jgi:hypothetical protein
MRKKLGAFILGVFVFVGSVGLATKSLLMNLASVSFEKDELQSFRPRRAFASSEEKKLSVHPKDKI